MLTRRFAVTMVLAMFASAAIALAAATDFDFKDPKGVNTIAFILDSTIEPIIGVASGISGTVSFDPANPKATTGKIVVQTKSLHTENKGMKETLHGDDWLDATKNPTIEFNIKKVTDAKSGEKDTHELTVVGDLTIKGVTKEVTAPVKLTYLPGKLSERTSKLKGDLLMVRSNFVIKRSDFNIKPEMDGKVVASDIELRVSIAGGAATK
jgi:polyisoprenoid-binding protein YceI